jgi:hypothetical protein
LRPASTLTPRLSLSTHLTTRSLSNRVYDPIRIPPTFHDLLRVSSASNTLLLALFSTSACPSCKTITPLLTDIVNHRSPSPRDGYSALAFAEVQLDSGDTSNGNMTDIGVEYGVRSMPTLIGFGGRRAERVTERLSDLKVLGERKRLEEWIDQEMEKGDPYPSGGDGAGGSGKGLLARLFGG